MIQKSIIILWIIFNSANLYCGTIDPDVSDSKYIKYGHQFEYVGKICGSYKDNTKFCASTVAIDDHYVLTAAHVVKDNISCAVYFHDKEFCISTMIVHKDFDEEKFGIADIAIGYSEKPFDLTSYPLLYEDNDEQDKICAISGYGFTGTFITGANKYDNKKRAGLNMIDSIQQDLLICSPSKNKNKTSLEFLIASGDSGGGLFINNKLAGINSCVMGVDKPLSSKYNEESGHTRVSKFVEWIKTHKTK